MKKSEAREIAREFAKAFPDLAGRKFRMGYSCPTGYNVHFSLYRTPVDSKSTRKVASGTPGSAYFVQGIVGHIYTQKVMGNGLSQWHSWVATPLDEDLEYCQECNPQFTLEEKLEVAEWMLESYHDPETHWQLEDTVRILHYQIEEQEMFRDEAEKWKAIYEAEYKNA